jgi:enediyne biosynthesis protein E4
VRTMRIFRLSIAPQSVPPLLLLGAALALAGSGCHPAAPAAPAAPLAAAGAEQRAGERAGESAGGGWFADEATARGVAFVQGHGGRSPLTVLETMGTGCAMLDFDGDGHLDLFLVGQKDTGETGRCALYRNNGDGTFTDVTAGSGLEEPGLYMGCAVGDVDNDGLPDLLVTGYGVNRLYRNLGGGKFKDVTAGSGLESPSPTSWQTSAGFADVDGDGRLDLYVGRYVVFNDSTIQYCSYGGVLKASCGPMFYDPQFGSLYRNVGGFRFQDVTREWGLGDQKGKCLGVVFGDVNGDGWPDLYIGNDEMPGDFYVNQDGKRFTNEALTAGVAFAFDGQMQGAMGVDFGDFNRSGLLDLIVTTYEFEPASLYANRSRLLFENVSLAQGLDAPTRPLVGFGTKFADLDNDGWLDLPVANGHIHDNQELIDKLSAYRQPMQLFMNEQGRKWNDRSQDAGPGFTTPGVGRGLAVGDVDNDGGLDLLVTDLEGRARLLMNRMPQRGNWLRIALEGKRSNRMGIGARVEVTAGEQRWVRYVTTSGSYLSASDPRVHVGLGDLTAVDRIEVQWPGGARSVVASPAPGDLTVREP